MQFSSTIFLPDPRAQVGCISMVVVIIGQRSHVRTAYYTIPPSSRYLLHRLSDSNSSALFLIIIPLVPKTIITTLNFIFPHPVVIFRHILFNAQHSLSLFLCCLVPSSFPPPRLHMTTSYFTPTATTSYLSILLLSTDLNSITLSNIEN